MSVCVCVSEEEDGRARRADTELKTKPHTSMWGTNGRQVKEK